MASKRITLTKGQLSTDAGDSLLKLLVQITDDGEITIRELNQLRAWLDACDVSMPAVDWLREIVSDVLEDGRATPDERYDLLVAIERVLPKAQRESAKERRQETQQMMSWQSDSVGNDEQDDVDEDDEPATTKQKNYIKVLGGEVTPGLTKDEASDLIDTLVSGPSRRQMMVLRFWDQLDVAEGGKAGVSDWMDGWYAEDRDRQRAWELWKRDTGDSGRQESPEKVPIGVGYEYLKKVKGGGCLWLVTLPLLQALHWVMTHA